MESSEWDLFITKEVNHFLREFQEMQVMVPTGRDTTTSVPVHVPYMLQTVNILENPASFTKLAQRHQDRLIRVKRARDHAPDAVKAFFHEHFYDNDGKEQWVACGRGDLESIKTLVQTATTQGLIPAGEGKPHPDGFDVRQWMKTYGIGIDCSAFVQHTLTWVVRQCQVVTSNASNESKPYSVGWMRTGGVYSNLTREKNNDDRFVPVATPSEARPGDILIYRHIRIVVSVESLSEGGLVLHLAESTSAKDIPTGQSDVEADIGPRRLDIQYPEPHRPIGEQTPLRKRYGDDVFTADVAEQDYILGRLRALTRFYTIKFYRTKDTYGCFSNFARYPIELKNQTWPTSEHYFQAQKFAGTVYEEEIRFAHSPSIAAQMGRDRNKPLRPDWETVKDDVMREAVFAKFSQHPEIREILLNTGDSVLVEHTKNDRYWADGGDGSGKNMLGKILMETREKLREIK
jgi:ribA/ribD-fused uncharacterized protein